MPDLADKLTEEQHGQLGEQDRSLYVKGEDNSFSLHPTIVAERTRLTTKNAQVIAEKKAAADKAAAFEALGLDAEKLKEIVEKHQQAEASKLTDAEKLQRKEQSIKQAHEQELNTVKTAAKQREDFLMTQLRSHMIDAVAQLAIEKAGVIEGGVEALKPHIVAAMDMLEDGEDDDKKFVTRIIGGDKQPRYVGAEYMTPEQLVEEYKKKPGFMGLFKASGKGGSGATTGQQNRNTTSQRDASNMNATDKIAQGLQNRTR